MGEHKEGAVALSQNGSDLYFENVTLLVTHYNRSRSLEQLLVTLGHLGILFKSIIVSDDGSNAEHLTYLKELQGKIDFRICTTSVNRGLGNNLNKGQDEVRSIFTLYIQEDFIPTESFKERLQNGVELLEKNHDYDVVRFYAYNKYPYLIPHMYGFSKMIFKWWYPGLGKFAYYSDHPHLRRSSFFEKFGRYREGISGDQTEFGMMMSFIQNNGRAFFYEDYQSLLIQANSSVEPSTMKRDYWRNSDNFFVSIVRSVYRYLKFYYSYFFLKFKR